MFRGDLHVIVGSGLTIAGAVACLSFTRLPYFQSLGLPAALGVLVALVAALTLGPAVLVIGQPLSGCSSPNARRAPAAGGASAPSSCGGPSPILVASIAVALIGLLALPGYKTSFDARPYLPATPAAVGYAAAERHFSEARLNPELLMIESDHDMRNPADMIVLERVAKAVFHTPGIAWCSRSPGPWARRSATAPSRFRSARAARQHP